MQLSPIREGGAEAKLDLLLTVGRVKPSVFNCGDDVADEQIRLPWEALHLDDFEAFAGSPAQREAGSSRRINTEKHDLQGGPSSIHLVLRRARLLLRGNLSLPPASAVGRGRPLRHYRGLATAAAMTLAGNGNCFRLTFQGGDRAAAQRLEAWALGCLSSLSASAFATVATPSGTGLPAARMGS